MEESKKATGSGRGDLNKGLAFRVSEWRYVRLKTLLLNGVHSAIRYDPELRAYYQRKCGEGKHPKSVKNAVVCKLLYRVFAVINRGTPYVKLYEHKAIKKA